jgi:hypothetical protein
MGTQLPPPPPSAPAPPNSRPAAALQPRPATAVLRASKLRHAHPSVRWPDLACRSDGLGKSEEAQNCWLAPYVFRLLCVCAEKCKI